MVFTDLRGPGGVTRDEEMPPGSVADSTRGLVLLALGAGFGIALAVTGLMTSGRDASRDLPPSAVARVNGEVIRAEDYERAVSALAQDRRDGLDAAQRRQVLDRLIDEELLVERALELGLGRRDAKVRKDLTAAVIDAVVAEYQDRQPGDDELQVFYEQNRDFFVHPGRLRVRQIFCRVGAAAAADAALARAQQAVSRLRAGEEFAAVRGALGDDEIAPPPDALLPPGKLADYLGPTALRAALSLQPGEVSDPVRSNTGYHVLQLVDAQADAAPAFAEVKPQVLAEFRRRAGERALRSYLDDLRSRAAIVQPADLP